MGGKLVEGKWQKADIVTSDKSGAFEREASQFDHKITSAEKDRYHLYVSCACPWANRTLIMRNLKGLQDIISVSVVHPHMLDHGWTFETDFKGATGDLINHKKYLYEIYQAADPGYSGKATVPVLWDKKERTIVNNESEQILRILNSGFNHLAKNKTDFYPKDLQHEIDSLNDKIYNHLNNGVYKCGFSRTQESYDKAVEDLFSTLDYVEDRLERRKYLCGDVMTEADVRLFVTLVRFDIVYYFHFKCNLRPIHSYANLQRYLENLYSKEEFRETIHFDHIKEHYYFSQETVNPYRIIPVGPERILS